MCIIEARVPQYSDLAPNLYNIFEAYIPQTNYTLLTFDHNTVSEKDINLVMHHLQYHANLIVIESKNWMIKIN